MVNIWKIGSAPALWGNKKTSTDKKRYIKYALGYEAGVKEGFVAIGYGWIPDIKELYTRLEKTEAEGRIRIHLEEHNKGKIWKRIEEIWDFAINIREGNVILLYYADSKAYVGIVKEKEKIYYYVERRDDRDYFGKFELSQSLTDFSVLYPDSFIILTMSIAEMMITG